MGKIQKPGKKSYEKNPKTRKMGATGMEWNGDGKPKKQLQNFAANTLLKNI